MNLYDAIKGRRSIRKYKPEPVDDATLERLIGVARWAPSWANTQCVRYVIVRDRTTREKLVATMSERNPAREAVAGAPVVVALVAQLNLSGCKKGEPVDDKEWHMFDAGMAMQNFCLMAHAEGLGTVVCGSFDYRAAGDVLNVPDGHQVVAFTPLGYPEGEAKAPPRKEIAELTHRESFA